MVTMRTYWSLKGLVGAAAAASLLIAACDSPHSRSSEPISYKDCVDNVPDSVRGLKLLSGPRSEKSVVRDMTPAICSGHVLFERMRADGQGIEPGSVVLRVVVEYTGEVNQVTIEETTIQSDVFLSKLRSLVLNTDFVMWRDDHDADSEFLYPAHFGR
jgi:hypothetical protein